MSLEEGLNSSLIIMIALGNQYEACDSAWIDRSNVISTVPGPSVRIQVQGDLGRETRTLHPVSTDLLTV